MEANNQNQTIMVVGSTGFLGMEICRRLLEANKQVKGLVRATSDETKVAALNQLVEEKGLYYAMWRQQIGERKVVAVAAATTA